MFLWRNKKRKKNNNIYQAKKKQTLFNSYELLPMHVPNISSVQPVFILFLSLATQFCKCFGRKTNAKKLWP